MRCGKGKTGNGATQRERATFVLRDLPRYFSIKLLGTRRRASPPSKLRHRRNDGGRRAACEHNEPRSFSRDTAAALPVGKYFSKRRGKARRKSLTRAGKWRCDFVFRWYSRQNAARDFGRKSERWAAARRVWFLKQRRGYAEYLKI